ncbi:MAG: response regulator [Alphaproteobacteria bacterium]
MSKGTIILVDDEAPSRRLYSEFLGGNDYNVITASDGHEALGLLYRVTPKLILLDILMPEMNGIETCKRIRANGEHKMPIIFITSLEYADHIKEGLLAGGDDYILKDGSLDHVLERVRYWSASDARRKAEKRRGKAIKDVTNYLDQHNLTANRAHLKWRDDPVALALTDFLERALAVVGERFGQSEEQQLYFLGYVAGIVDYELEKQGTLKPQMQKYIRGALHASGIMNEEQVKQLLQHLDAVAANDLARDGYMTGRRDKGAADAAGPNFIPRGLMEFKVKAA